MSIGGIDRILFAPADVSVSDAILQLCRDLWPKCIFQASDDAAGYEIDDPWVWMHGTASDEFFVFADRTAFETWNEFGALQENSNKMLHFIVRPHSGAPYGLFEVTIVADHWDEAMLALHEGLRNAFQAIYHIPVRQSAA